MPPDLTIPPDLLPADGRFGSGPTKVRPEALASLAATGSRYLGTSHRQSGVRAVVGRVRAGLAELFALPEGYEVVLGVGGATLFWDAAAFCLIERRSQHVVIGEFSEKFAAAVAAAPHLDDPEVVASPPGTAVFPMASDVDAYAQVHNETSTGVAMALHRPDNRGLVLVDGTSAAGAISVSPADFDAYYFSPQKAFGADGGLWLALVSPAAVERLERLAATRPVPPMLDLAIALGNSRREQTYNTPALATLYLLAEQVDWMLGNGGLSWAVAHSKAGSKLVYDWAEHSPLAEPFVADPEWRSPVTATIDLDASISADDVVAVLAANGIVDIGGYRKLGRNQLRIGVWPSTDHEDLARLLSAIDYVMERL